MHRIFGVKVRNDEFIEGTRKHETKAFDVNTIITLIKNLPGKSLQVIKLYRH